MNDRFKFRAFIDWVSFYDDDGNEYEKSFYLYDVAVYKYGDCSISRDDLFYQLKKQGFSDEEVNQVYGSFDCCYDDWYNFEPSALEQCTGLKDKNGKLIYEGDIVEVTNLTKTYSLKTPVIWEKEIGAFMVWGNKEKSFGNYIGALMEEDEDGVVHYTVEVIGNIHENPELMEQSNDD